MDKPGQLPSRSGHIAATLQARIVRGEYQPGDQLRQDALAAEFGTSPSPVREALRELGNAGLVEHVTNRGVFVASVTQADLLDVLLPVRLTLESYAVQHLVDRDRTLDALQEVVAGIQRAAAEGDLERVNDRDLAFHQTLMEGSASPHAAQIWLSVLPRTRLQISVLSVEHSLADIVAEHQVLLEAIITGGSCAVSALEDHIIGTARRLLPAAEDPTARLAPDRDSSRRSA